MDSSGKDFFFFFLFFFYLLLAITHIIKIQKVILNKL